MNKLTITMESDWHIGSGNGRPGNVDRLIKRDANGLPYIPGKTLTGVLRDACELLVYGLDDRHQGVWHQWLDFLFGTQPALHEGTAVAPLPAALSIRAAQLPAQLQNAVAHKPLTKAAMTFVKPGIAIDGSSGCAKPDYLRFEEMARGGMVLEAPYELLGEHWSQEEAKTAKALICACAALLERIGGKRRRGAGRCQVNVSDLLLADAITLLEKQPPCFPPERPALQEEQDVLINAKTDKQWVRVDLDLTAQAPVIIAECTLGNLVKTIDYIPGSCLLPILSKRLQAAGVELRQAIAGRQIVVTHALPTLAGQTSRPIPLALFQEKLNPSHIHNRLIPPEISEQDRSSPQVKGLRAGYLVGEKTSTYLKPSTEVITHNIVEDRHQRPSEAVGGVYSYQAMPVGTTFRSTIYLQSTLLTPEAEKALQGLAHSTIKLGRTKKDDYGAVEVDQVKVYKVKPRIDQKAKTAQQQPMELKVWLLSDVLLRDQRLRPSTNPDDLARVIGQQLGNDVSLTLRRQGELVFARQRRTDSWQTKWGLPRPSLVGLKAGSCFVFEVLGGTVDAHQLALLEQVGVGERTVEGFGQLCFNHPVLLNPKPTVDGLEADSKEKDNPSPNNAPAITRGTPAYDTARIIEREAWRSEIRRQALGLAAQAQQREALLGIALAIEKGEVTSKPTMSQLGVLRAVLRNLTYPFNQEASNRISSWIDNFQEKRGEQWPEGSLEKIKTLLIQPDVIWQHLQLDLDALTLTGKVEGLKNELWVEAVQGTVLTYIRAHRRDSDKSTEHFQGGEDS